MVSDLSEVVRVRSGEIRRFCSHVWRSQEAKIWVTKVFGHKIPMDMASDLSEVFRVWSGEIRRFCSHMEGSQKAQIRDARSLRDGIDYPCR